MRRFLCYIFAVITAVAVFCQTDNSAIVIHVPDVHGVLRSRWEMQTTTGEQRFQLRNARINISGSVVPGISYYLQTDFCDSGKFKFLDGWGRVQLVKGLALQAGQFRMPFGEEPHLGPSTYLFANRAFIGKQMMNYRAVGAKADYRFETLPLTVEGGVFNPSTIDDQTAWSKTVAASAKAILTLPEGWKVSGSFASIKPGEHRANIADAYLSWTNPVWTVAGEYIYKSYCGDVHNDAQGYTVFADWRRQAHVGMFNQWSVQARLDGMSDHYKLNRATDEFNESRTRITLGTTLSYKYKKVGADFRVNYENIVSGETSDARDRIVAELVITF